MLTKKQLGILKVFRENLLRRISFSDLKKELKEKSSSKLQRTILNFKEEDLIKIEKIGKTNLISLNYDNNKLFYYLSIFNLESNASMPFNILCKIQQEILKETEFFSLVVFGSYTKGESTKKSDLDVALIIESDEIKNRIIPRINSIKRRELQRIDMHIFTRKEFLEMLRDEKENLGKEIVRNNFIIYGLINFYKLILKEVGNVRFS